MIKDNLLHFVCAKCETHLSVESQGGGIKAPCPSCGKEITSPQKPKTAGVSSLQKVTKAVSAQPAKPDVKISSQKETRKVQTASVGVRTESVNPKTGLTKAEEEYGEFAAVVKLLVLGLLIVAVMGFAVYHYQAEIFQWLERSY